MKTIVAVFLFSACMTLSAHAQTGGDILKGCKMLQQIEAHDCKDGNCAHFKKNEVLRAIGSYQFFVGYVLGVRTSQAAGQSARMVDFPADFDPHALVAPLISYLESDPKAQAQHASIGVYTFLLKTYPGKKR